MTFPFGSCRIAFTDENGQINVSNLDGSDRRAIPNCYGYDPVWLQWSLDGSPRVCLMFVSCDRKEIWRYDPANGGFYKHVSGGNGISAPVFCNAQNPVDGSFHLLWFWSGINPTTGAREIYTGSDYYGMMPQTIVSNGWNPAIPHMGDFIAFTAMGSASNPQIWTADLNYHGGIPGNMGAFTSNADAPGYPHAAHAAILEQWNPTDPRRIFFTTGNLGYPVDLTNPATWVQPPLFDIGFADVAQVSGRPRTAANRSRLNVSSSGACVAEPGTIVCGFDGNYPYAVAYKYAVPDGAGGYLCGEWAVDFPKTTGVGIRSWSRGPSLLGQNNPCRIAVGRVVDWWGHG